MDKLPSVARLAVICVLVWASCCDELVVLSKPSASSGSVAAGVDRPELDIVNDILIKLEEARVQNDVGKDDGALLSDSWSTDEQFTSCRTWMGKVMERSEGLRSGRIKGERFDPELMALREPHWQSLSRILEALRVGRTLGHGFAQVTASYIQTYPADVQLWRAFLSAGHGAGERGGEEDEGGSGSGREGSDDSFVQDRRRGERSRQRGGRERKRRARDGASERNRERGSVRERSRAREHSGRGRGGRERERSRERDRQRTRRRRGRKQGDGDAGGKEEANRRSATPEGRITATDKTEL